MTGMVQVLKKEQLWNDYIIEGLKNHLSEERIKENLIEVMRKEIFGLLTSRLNVDDIRDAPQTTVNEKIVESTMRQAMLKWRSLIRMCNMYKETLNLICEEDLANIWDDEEEENEEEENEEEEDDFTVEDLKTNDIPEETGTYRNSDTEITPGMRFPAGYWTR